MTPPRLARVVVEWLAPREIRASLLDDLDEAFGLKAASVGVRRARRWYWMQALSGVAALIRVRRRNRGTNRSQTGGASPHTRGYGSMATDLIRQDLLHAWRSFRTNPGFTAIAVTTLALGIGANTAVFSAVRAVLLRPLPYIRPHELVLVTPPDNGGSVTLTEFFYWKTHAATFAASAARGGPLSVQIRAGGEPEPIRLLPVTSDFFRTLGVTPALGREFGEQEMRANGPRGVILTDALWRRLWGADPSIVGRDITIGETDYPVTGVLPPDVWLPDSVDAFFPLRLSGGSSDNGLNFTMVARLAPGATASHVAAEMAMIGAAFVRDHPTLADSFQGLTTLSYQASLVGDVRTSLLLLFGGVVTLLIIACINLGGLLLARTVARSREIAVRLAFGASTGRLIRQLVFENLALCAVGTLSGVAVAYGALDAFVALVPFALPLSAPIRIDVEVLMFAVGVGLATGLGLAVVPLAASSPRRLSDTLRASGRVHGGTRRQQRARSALVVAEIALSVTLLVGAALLAQTLYRMQHEPLGFSTEGLLTFWTPAQTAFRQDETARWAFESATIARLSALPGVEGVGGVNVLPLTTQNNFPAERAGFPDEAIGGMEIRAVTPAYFDAMRTPIRQGRAFTDRDTVSGESVIMVNETLARRWWKGASPLGDHVIIGQYKGKPVNEKAEAPRVVVGVVADMKSVYLKLPPRPTVFIPSAQATWVNGGTAWVVRGDLQGGLAERVRQTIVAADRRVRVDRMRPMADVVSAFWADSRFAVWLCGALAGLALVLTGVGLYGLLAFAVERRMGELSVRVALGATRFGLLGLVVRQGLGLTAMGVGLGLAGAATLGRLIASLLFGVTPTDVVSFAAVTAVFAAIGLIASLVPGRRAARVDPLAALRSE